MQVPIGVSNRHIHLTESDLELLCGTHILTNDHNLNQPGQYASTLKLSIETPKKRMDNIRVIGPTRDYTQVELSKTDAYTLGINPPVRVSGDLTEAATITIIGPSGSITRSCAIIPTRHIHIDPLTREKLGLTKVKTVEVKISSLKGGLLSNVIIKEQPQAYFEMHLDTDDANSHLVICNDKAEIII
ncbi:MAG: PduL/EutD family phosphate acyltransferase [Bacilli bacterium]